MILQKTVNYTNMKTFSKHWQAIICIAGIITAVIFAMIGTEYIISTL